jgi:hypothetical protein
MAAFKIGNIRERSRLLEEMEMQPVPVAYARGVVDNVIEVLCESSGGLGYTLWSLMGNPC